jgi:hypothetical protein
MKILGILFGIIIINLPVSASSQTDTCNCAQLLKETVQNVSTIYAGFDDKVTKATSAKYNGLVKSLLAKAVGVKGERQCYEIIKRYTDWFKDGHVGMWYGVKSSAKDIPRFPIDKVSDMLNKKTDDIEGRWATVDKSQEYAIIKDPSGLNKYIAVTLKSNDSLWKEGMVRTEFYGYNVKERLFRGMFYKNDFSGALDGFTLSDGGLDHWFGPSWYKEGSPIRNIKSSENVSFKIINTDFIYLRLSKFNQEDVDKLDSFLLANKKIIKQTKNLILDLRGNPGGNASTSNDMIRLIYTNPVVYPAWQYRSSPQLIKAKEATILELKKNDPYKLLNGQQALLTKLKEQKGQLVGTGDSVVRTVKTPSRYPERVAFLIDKGAASSAEFLTFEGKQSKKVTLFGTASAGVMDYGEVQNFSLSCGQYIISIPWGRNGWIERFGFRVDNIGFKPDVTIPSNEKDWVGFVMKYWTVK